MKSFLIALLFLGFSAVAQGGLGSENVVTCTDQKGRVIVIERVNGSTGGVPGSYIASVTASDGRPIGIPTALTKSHPNPADPMIFSGGGIVATVDTINFMDLPSTKTRGSLQILGDAEASPMICDKGPALLK